MIFRVDPDGNEELVGRRVSEGGLIEVGVSFVLFGCRVRAGRVGSFAYDLDYCAGPNQRDVEVLLAVVLAILEKQDEASVEWGIFPRQSVKPVFRDFQCWTELLRLAGDFGDVPGLPDLYDLKRAQLADHMLLMQLLGGAVEHPDSAPLSDPDYEK